MTRASQIGMFHLIKRFHINTQNRRWNTGECYLQTNCKESTPPSPNKASKNKVTRLNWVIYTRDCCILNISVKDETHSVKIVVM